MCILGVKYISHRISNQDKWPTATELDSVAQRIRQRLILKSKGKIALKTWGGSVGGQGHRGGVLPVRKSGDLGQEFKQPPAKLASPSRVPE